MPETRPIKVAKIVTPKPNSLVKICRRWKGPIVLLAGNTVLVIQEPDQVVVPLELKRSKLAQERDAELLRKGSPFPADVYVVAVETSAGQKKTGMIAVPVNAVPVFVCT